MVPDLHNVGEKHGGCIIYQAFARHPQVLWLAEPFSALGVMTRSVLGAELNALKQRLARPILHLTHDLYEA